MLLVAPDSFRCFARCETVIEDWLCLQTANRALSFDYGEVRKWRVDVYLLKLDGTLSIERLCDWTNYPGYRSDNPVVSPDGKIIAIQRGFMAGAGQGRGIVLFDLEKYRQMKEIR
jgi:hypothetical protein